MMLYTYISKRHTTIKYAIAFSLLFDLFGSQMAKCTLQLGGEDVTVSCRRTPAHELTLSETVPWPYMGRQHVRCIYIYIYTV